MKEHRLCLALATTLLSACFNPDIEPGRPCGTEGSCPPGQECMDNFCRLPDYMPPPTDASSPDGAMPDAGPPLSENAKLRSLLLSVPGLQGFSPDILQYDLYVSMLVRSLRVTAHTDDEGATLEIDGNPVANDELSPPISVASDGVTTVSITVTAPAGNEPKTYTVEVHPGGSVTQYGPRKADNAGVFDSFGWHVAIDGETMAVSAPGEASCTKGFSESVQTDDGCLERGAVYVFQRKGSDWALEAYLKPFFEPFETGDKGEFGVGLALDDDTLVVGAFHEDDKRGAAYVFRRRLDGVWIEEAHLKPTDPRAGQEFGWSVAIADDLIAVGARREDSDKGAVYLFQRGGNGWTQTQQLTAPTPQAGAFFGYSVAVAGGVVVVGACGQGCPPDSNPPPDNTAAGAAYVFRGPAWQQVSELASLASPSPEPADAFGFAVALARDGNTVVIGAPGDDSDSKTINDGEDDNSANDSGAAYVFRYSGAWSRDAYLKANDTDVGDQLGSSVAIADTLVVVGAVHEGTPDVSLRDGAVYLYGYNGTTWSVAEAINPSNFSEDDEFGFRVALSDDTLVVGAPFQGPVGGKTGAVYLFH